MASRIVVYGLTVASVCLAAFFLPATADACSPPPLGWSVQLESQFPQQIPVDGAVVIEASIYDVPPESAASYVRVEVSDADGNMVDGGHDVAVLRKGDDSEPPGEGSDILVTWTAAAELAPDAEYTLTWQDEHPYTSLSDEQQVTFQTTSEHRAALQPATLDAPTAFIYETRAGFECCSDEELCDSCNICRRCWATRYAYLPGVKTTATLPDAGSPAQVYHEVIADGAVRERWWTQASTKDIGEAFDEDGSGPFCVEVATRSLVDASEVTSNVVCVNRDELPDYTERSPNESPPQECDIDAGDGGDGGDTGNKGDDVGGDTGTDGGNADDAGEDGGDDAATNSLQGSSGGGCGCGHTSGAVPGEPLGWLVWLGGVLVWRRLRGRLCRSAASTAL